MNENILIVDDEKEIADLIEVYLKNDGYTVHKFYNGTDALKCIESQNLDLVILDVMLPDVDGFRICQKIREQYFYPIIMLTAKVEDTDKIMGLTIGADDYITKPFNPLEVVARVKTQLRRYVRYNQPIHKGVHCSLTAVVFAVRADIVIAKRGSTTPAFLTRPRKSGQRQGHYCHQQAKSRRQHTLAVFLKHSFHRLLNRPFLILGIKKSLCFETEGKARV